MNHPAVQVLIVILGGMTIAFVALGVVFNLVQLITYAYLTAKYRFEQSHKPKEHLDNGHE